MLKTHTDISELLNNLVDMQASPAYAARKQVLVSAEQTLLLLDLENAKLKAELITIKEQEPVAWKAANGQWACCAKDAKDYERRMCVEMIALIPRPLPSTNKEKHHGT